MPGDLKYQPLREPVLKDDFDEWLARVVCFAFSLPPTPFVKQTNRATAETQQETATTEGLVPLQRWVKELMDRLLTDYFGEPDIEFQWATTPSLDPLVQAQVNQIYLAAGVKSVAEVRDELGLGKNLLGEGASESPAKVGKFNFDPNQPRDDHGMWTSEGGGSGNASADGAGARTATYQPASYLPVQELVLPGTSSEQLPNLIKPPLDELSPEEIPEEELPDPVKPPLGQFPADPSQPPGTGYVWRGPGAPGTKGGAWYNDQLKQSLRPDLDHTPGIKPHWDFKPRVSPEYPNKNGYRWYPDGTMEPKKSFVTTLDDEA